MEESYKRVVREEDGELFNGGVEIIHGDNVLYTIWSQVASINRTDALREIDSILFENDINLDYLVEED